MLPNRLRNRLPKLLAACATVVVMLAAAHGLRAAGPAVPDDEEDPYFLLCGQADQAIAEGRYEEAAARIIDAMSVRPRAAENVLLLSNLGMVYSYMGRDSLALATLDEAHRQAPAMRTVLANRARVLLKNGRDREAYRDFSDVLAADSLNAEALYYHGTIALYTGDTATAERDFSVLQSVAPDDIDTATALSGLYTATGRHAEAVPYLQRLTKDDPSPEYFGALATELLALDRISEASTAIADGLAKYPDSAGLYLCRARLNRARYRMDEARADARRAVELGASQAQAKAIFK